MKIHVGIDCTPEEARAFFGLPDVAPMQAAVMKEMQDRVVSAMKGTDAETLLKTWMPAGAASIEQMQKMLWNAFGGQGSTKEGGK